ncbi:hypothetical protein Tco_0206081 [Tanacetum coccineum]
MSRRVESSRDEDSLGEDASKQGRGINDIDADKDITLVNVQDDAEMFDVNTLTGDEDKGKGIMVEEPVKTMKKKDLIRLDEETAKILQAKIEADHELAQRLQAEEQEELSVEEKAKLFQQLLEQRRKHFAAKSAEEKRNKPPTQAQQRKIMCTYLKNMEGKKPKDLKNKSFNSIQKIFDRAFKRVNTFVDFRTDLVEDKEEVAIDVVPLTTNPPTIVDWKIHKEGKKSYYQIVRADGKSQMYRVFSLMLKSLAGKTWKIYTTGEVTTASTKLLLLEEVTTASGRVNAASEEVSTAELVSTAYVYGGGRCGQKGGIDGVREVENMSDFYVIGQILKLAKLFNDLFSGHERGRGWLVICLSVGSGGGLVHLGGKSSSEFKYGCGEFGGVVKISSRGAKGVGSFGCGAIG